MATADTNLLSPPLTGSTRTFRESVHLIPSIRREERPPNYEPSQLSLWVLVPSGLFMVALGIALEVALYISNRDQGFPVKENNVFGTFASPDFLTHFIPILLVAPLVLLWDAMNSTMKRYQPYLNMARQETPANDSVLLDYVQMNAIYAVYASWKKRHWIVFLTAASALATLLLQPLAGSIFTIGQFPTNQTATAISTRSLGLDPDRFQLMSFLGGAGYVLGSVSLGLGDPPFVHNNWAAADFAAPQGDYLNGTLITNTTGVRTNATCTAPTSLTLNPISTTNFSISATSKSNCNVTAFFDPAAASQQQQYGVTAVRNCGPNANLNVTFLPVFFWFFSGNQRGQQGAGVFCQPTLEVFNIEAKMSLSDSSLGNVTIVSPFTDDNNVTGSPQNGVPFNGVIFDPAPDNFTEARALATTSGVSGAIFRSVTSNVTTAPNAFNSLDGFVDTTSRVYTQFLAVVAKNTYFMQQNNTLDATLTSQKTSLKYPVPPGHALSVLLILMGLLLISIALIHSHLRKSCLLVHKPGSIAGALSLTAHSGFGSTLVPYDTDESMASKFDQLRFSIDKRTGAIVATDGRGYRFTGGGGGGGEGSEESEDEVGGEKRRGFGGERRVVGRLGESGIVQRSHAGLDEDESLLGNRGTQAHVRDGSENTTARPFSHSDYQVEPFDYDATSKEGKL